MNFTPLSSFIFCNIRPSQDLYVLPKNIGKALHDDAFFVSPEVPFFFKARKKPKKFAEKEKNRCRAIDIRKKTKEVSYHNERIVDDHNEKTPPGVRPRQYV